MAEYLLFEADRKKDFDNEHGSNATLGEHIEYVFSQGGTPDFFDKIEADSYHDMKRQVNEIHKKTGINICVLDMDEERITYRQTSKTNDNELSR